MDFALSDDKPAIRAMDQGSLDRDQQARHRGSGALTKGGNEKIAHALRMYLNLEGTTETMRLIVARCLIGGK